jgi:hypothetical protein
MRTKIFFLFAMLASVAASAQSHINIEMLSATYTTSPAIKFRVSWSAIPTGTCHNSKIWLWVDFVKIENNQPTGSWTRATIANPSPGTVTAETDKGFWLQGATSGSYAATVTVTLTNIPANTTFNWCAYSSDCPPNSSEERAYRLRGTPPFILTSADGSTQTLQGNVLFASDMNFEPLSITDATGCIEPLCPYMGSDLYKDASHLCQKRTSGAQNWEAYIQDERDNKIYRIIRMPNNEWWFADYLDYIESGITTFVNDGLRYYMTWPTCPANWTMWTATKAKSIFTTYGSTNLQRVKSTTTWTTSTAGDDYYGLNIKPTACYSYAWTTIVYNKNYSLIDNVLVPVIHNAADHFSGIADNAWADDITYDGMGKSASSPSAPVRCYRAL